MRRSHESRARGLWVCADCGCSVDDETAHDRFHAIQNDWARAIAMLLVAHVGPGVHDKYDVKDRYDAKRNENNWSAEAFAEVVGDLPAAEDGTETRGVGSEERT